MSGLSLKLRFGVNAGLAAALFLGILIVAALIANNHPYRVDLTDKGTHTLSPQTKKIVRGLTGEVKLWAFYFEGEQERSKTRDLFDAYAYQSPKIVYEFVDPELKPAIVRKYDVKSAGTVVLEGYGKTQTVTLPSEQSITNALIKLTSSLEKKVYFLTGHGERELDDSERAGYQQLKQALEKENYRAEKLNLLRESAVPEDAAVVVAAAPQKRFLDAEIESLKGYLAKGGRVLVMLQPFSDGGLKDLLAGYGIVISEDIVVDPLSRAMGGDFLVPIVATSGNHPIAANTRSNMIFPQARSTSKAEALPPEVSIEELVVTSPGSWAETGMDELDKGEVRFTEGKDTPGPLTVGLIADIKVPKKESDEAVSGEESEEASVGAEGEGSITPKDGDSEAGSEKTADTEASEDAPDPEGVLVVYGNADFANNTFLSMLGNRDLILNTVSYLSEDRDQVSIRPKEADFQPLTLSRNQSLVLFWISIVLMPLIVLILGIAVYRIRRQHR